MSILKKYQNQKEQRLKERLAIDARKYFEVKLEDDGEFWIKAFGNKVIKTSLLVDPSVIKSVLDTMRKEYVEDEYRKIVER
ncbi:MAG: hypothetical protein LUD72_06265 [Bacteroidales bacterium]|nr:hypothetical protein [Bacteroidales bacterium]